MEKAKNEQMQQGAYTTLKMMPTALKEMRTKKKNRENLPELDDQGRSLKVQLTEI